MSAVKSNIYKKSLWERFTATSKQDPHYHLKKWVWIFYLLLIFDGALRKWFLPFLATPLLLVRDPVILWLVMETTRRNMLKFNIYLTGMAVVGVSTYFTAVIFGHGNTLVAFYGLRALLLYFPMIFIIGTVFNQEDVIRMGKVTLYIAIPMTLLIGMQFYSPQSALVNRGVGGDMAGAGFGGAMGYLRPPGTFSFTNGVTLFYSLVAPFLLYFWFNTKRINQRVLILASAAMLIAIPLSISRALLLQTVLSVSFMLVAVSRNPRYFGKIVMGLILVVMSLSILSNLSFFKTATEAFTERFEGANETEGGLVEGVLGERFLGQMVNAIFKADEIPTFGYGVGSGTQLGEKMLNDDRASKVADFEWMRIIAEIGLLGLFVIFIRVGLSIKLMSVSFSKLAKNNILPWLITSNGITLIIQGGMHQPTALGFLSLVGGLWIASTKVVRKTNAQINETTQPVLTGV